MPDFAPSATPRYVLKYVSAGVEHTIMFRAARGTSNGALQTIGEGAADDLFDALSAIMPDDLAAISATLYPQDTDVGIPTGTPTLPAGAVDTSAWSAVQKIHHLTFSGKGTGGSKVNVKVYGANIAETTTAIGGDGKLAPGESADVDAAVAALSAQSGLRAIDNTAVAVWYPRVTFKTNDYWLRRARQGLV